MLQIKSLWVWWGGVQEAYRIAFCTRMSWLYVPVVCFFIIPKHSLAVVLEK